VEGFYSAAGYFFNFLHQNVFGRFAFQDKRVSVILREWDLTGELQG
jgi:hypothetical protein